MPGTFFLMWPKPISSVNYADSVNQQGEISKYGLDGPKDFDPTQQPGGSTANYIRTHGGRSDWQKQGLMASDIAFKGTPGVEQAFTALNARHAAAVVNINGRLWDSAFDIQLKGFPKYGFPWTAISHQAFYNTAMAGGMSAMQALGSATAHAGWSFYLSSSIYGINGGYGMMGIFNAETREK